MYKIANIVSTIFDISYALATRDRLRAGPSLCRRETLTMSAVPYLTRDKLYRWVEARIH